MTSLDYQPAVDSRPVPSTQRGDLRIIALVLIGATLMTGHVQAGFARFGPLTLLPIAAYGAAILSFTLAIPGRLRSIHGVLVCGLALVVVLPAILQTASSDYGEAKLGGFIQLTLAFAMMAALLVDDLHDVEHFWNGVIGMGLTGVAISVLDLASGVDLGARGSINEALMNPISIGRIGGITALWFGFRGMPSLAKPWRYLLVVVGIAILVAAASRGPMLAFLVAGLVAAVRSHVLRGRVAIAVVVAAVAVTAGVGQGVLEDATERVVEADRNLSVDDADGASRIVLWAESTTAILDKPIGWGLGQFGVDGDVAGSGEYPHNVLLEIALELGLIALVVVVFAWWRAVRYLWTHPDEERSTRHLALFVFWTVAAMFSSDFNGNRVLVGALLALSAVVISRDGRPDQPRMAGP